MVLTNKLHNLEKPDVFTAVTIKNISFGMLHSAYLVRTQVSSQLASVASCCLSFLARQFLLPR
jgi:hypothetical protein